MLGCYVARVTTELRPNSATNMCATVDTARAHCFSDVSAESSRQFQLHSAFGERTRHVAVKPARHQASLGEDVAVRRPAPWMPPLEVAFHVVTGCVRLQKGYPGEPGGEVANPSPQNRLSYILNDVRTDDEVEPFSERQRRQILEAAEPNISPPPIFPNHVVARINAQVPQARTHSPKLGAPSPFPGSNIQNGSYLAPQEILRHA